MRRTILVSSLRIAASLFSAIHAQNQPPRNVEQPNQSMPVDIVRDNQPAPGNNPESTADYPKAQAGIFIQGAEWTALANRMPSKTRSAHGIAASLSYGAIPVKIVAEYAGEHASTQVSDAQPTLCLCHFVSLPGDPVLVKLHPKKGARELDGGRMFVYPVVGNSKMADANKSDLIPADVSQPDSHVWLVRPQSPLEPGEYALMLGTQNLSIFPFAVVPPPAPPTGAN